MSDEAVVADSGQGVSGGDAGFDMDQASDQLAGDLFGDSRAVESADDAINETVDTAVETTHVDETTAVSVKEAQTTEPAEEAEPAPKTWPKEMHEHWGKTPKEVREYWNLREKQMLDGLEQYKGDANYGKREYWNLREKQMLDGLEQYKGDANYGKQMRDAITPYMALIQAQGIDAPKAVQTLLNAHYKLSVSSPSQKQQYLQYIARQYGISTDGLGQPAGGQPAADPRYQQLQDQLYLLQQHIQGQQQAATKHEQERIAGEVNAFASDKAHPYFDEVADEMVSFIRSGASLQDAYEKAVWANPVTRAKEQARVQQDQQAEAKRKAQEAAEAAKKAAAANIRSRDTRRTPTEQPRGTMRNLDSVMTEVMREIKQAH